MTTKLPKYLSEKKLVCLYKKLRELLASPVQIVKLDIKRQPGKVFHINHMKIIEEAIEYQDNKNSKNTNPTITKVGFLFA